MFSHFHFYSKIEHRFLFSCRVMRFSNRGVCIGDEKLIKEWINSSSINCLRKALKFPKNQSFVSLQVRIVRWPPFRRDLFDLSSRDGSDSECRLFLWKRCVSSRPTYPEINSVLASRLFQTASMRHPPKMRPRCRCSEQNTLCGGDDALYLIRRDMRRHCLARAHF